MKFMNEANWDRILRVIVGVVLLYLGFSGTVAGGFGAAVKVIGFLSLLTGLVGFCPLYALLRFQTKHP